MRLTRLGAAGAEKPYVQADDGLVYDLSSVTAEIDGAFLANDGIAKARRALACGTLPLVQDWQSLRIGAPVVRPTAVICIGMNYAGHAAESGSLPPTTPVVFFKHPNTIVGPNDDVLLPPGARQVDWEAELAIVIGTRTRYLAGLRQVRQHIAGFTVSNDISERNYQIEQSGGQWSKGKCCETFNPLGPALVPADELDYQNLRLRSTVNGQARQDSSTADMIFSVDYLVWHLSQFMVLEPGDIINTGTPQGVALSGRFPYLADGDEMVMEIDGIGAQRQRLRNAIVEAGSGSAA